jgi:CDP-6-deoxy-D-xylo-4-hexulose-3-dehydrase
MEGGLIVTDDEELYHILICLRAHGWTRNLPDLNHVSGKKSKIEFEEAFKFILPGYNVRPLEMSGALGQEQLKKLNSIISGRRSNAQKFHQLFKNNENITIQKENSFSSHFGFSIIFQNKETRNELIKIFDSNDIEVRPIVAGNFLDNEVVKYCNYRVQDELINAKIVNDCGLFIGNHHFDISKELDQVKSIVDAFL